MSEHPDNRRRVLVFIVAYHAEKHLGSVLDRIPVPVLRSPDVDIIVIDDGSGDAGAEIGAAWAERHGAANISVLRNSVNQGYGGNQKLGYRIAVDAGYGLVVLLHGDGQYAPELLPEFIDRWRATGADVLLGSRMTDLASARRGRMPLYKLVGNRVLTVLQNAATGRHLSEYHTGYRAYSTDFLRRVPFELNTNEFHFDTEILYQAFHAGVRIEEFPIPTHYGDEISRVPGLKYAKDVVVATVVYRMHQVGMLCDLKFRRIEPALSDEAQYLAYPVRRLAIDAVARQGARRVLEFGCAPGFLTRALTARGVAVTGIDHTPPLPGLVPDFRLMDPERDAPPADAFAFDMILLLDVLEHLAEPEQFLVNLRNGSAVGWGRPGPAALRHRHPEHRLRRGAPEPAARAVQLFGARHHQHQQQATVHAPGAALGRSGRRAT